MLDAFTITTPVPFKFGDDLRLKKQGDVIPLQNGLQVVNRPRLPVWHATSLSRDAGWHKLRQFVTAI